MTYKGPSGYTYEVMDTANVRKGVRKRQAELEENLFFAELEQAEMRAVVASAEGDVQTEAKDQLDQITGRIKYLLVRIQALRELPIPPVPDDQED